MQIKEEKLFDMAATIVAGILANPANAHMTTDHYSTQLAITAALNSVQQAMMQACVEIVE